MESNDPILISKLKEMLVKEMKDHPILYDESDLERVKTNNWTVKRFLVSTKMSLNDAFNSAKKTMQWRKTYGINNRSDQDFPMEFYKIGIIFPYTNDKEEHPVIYGRIKLYKYFPKFSEYFRQYFIHVINKIDSQTNEKGFALIWDLTDSGPSNWDLSMITFIISSLRERFPQGLKYLIPYGVPWIMNPFVNIAIQLLPEESKKKVKFISKDQILEYVAKDKLPDFMNGLCTTSYKTIPEGVKSIKQIGELHEMSKHEIDKLLEYYHDYLQ